MKKVFLSAALALAVAGSWAFYPKAAAEPAGYMMVVSNVSLSGSDITLNTFTSDGQRAETLVPSTKMRYRFTDMHSAEVLKLNQLRREGWRVISTSSIPTSTGDGGIIFSTETTFVLEKN